MLSQAAFLLLASLSFGHEFLDKPHIKAMPVGDSPPLATSSSYWSTEFTQSCICCFGYTAKSEKSSHLQASSTLAFLLFSDMPPTSDAEATTSCGLPLTWQPGWQGAASEGRRSTAQPYPPTHLPHPRTSPNPRQSPNGPDSRALDHPALSSFLSRQACSVRRHSPDKPLNLGLRMGRPSFPNKASLN